jgi:hypothetical protein
MLRYLLCVFLPWLTVFLAAAPARAVLFLAPGAGSEEFQRYALEKNQQTYTQWVLQKSTNAEAEAHSQVLDFSQRAFQEKSSKQLLQDWNRLRQTLELNRSDREVLTLLAEKLHQTQELCRYIALEPDLTSLLEESQSTAACSRWTEAPPKSLADQLESNDLLVIDGKAFTKRQLPSRLAPGSYQWKILSDRYEDRRFTGTAEEFSRQQFFHQSWVSGHCGDYKLAVNDFSLQLQSQIYFSASCVNPGIPKEKTFGDWTSEHKTLLWGVGILAAGLAVGQLKDKTLVITRP